MGDQNEAMPALVQLCSRWSSSFPESAWEHGRQAANAGTFGAWLRAYPWPIGVSPNLDQQDWEGLCDSGVRDSLEHATSVVSEHGFTLALDHSITTTRGPRGIRVFLHSDGVLAQLEAAGDGSVSDFRLWGCAQVQDQALLSGIPACTSRLQDGSGVRIELGRAAGSFGIAWLTASTALSWTAPWPEPLVRTWLGPNEPKPADQSGPDLAQSSRLGRANTVAILERLPEHVHTTLGPIATTH